MVIAELFGFIPSAFLVLLGLFFGVTSVCCEKGIEIPLLRNALVFKIFVIVCCCSFDKFNVLLYFPD